MATLKEKAKAKMDAYKKARRKKKIKKTVDKAYRSRYSDYEWQQKKDMEKKEKKKKKKLDKKYKKEQPDRYMKREAGIPKYGGTPYSSDSPEKKKMPQSQSQWNIAAGARRKKNDALAAHSSFGIRTQEPQSHPVTKKKKKKKY